MSDLTIALRLLADTAGAEGGLRKLAESLRDLGVRQRQAAAEGDAAADATAAAWMDAAARIEAAAATAPAAIGQNSQIAAGQMGNLVAQFNDIGMMLAAGQNPLQLAIQQGTQITQVLGPMGAAGAARALGSAFMAMLSPINLITIGGIAAGAALLQWLTSGTEQALTLDDAMKALEEGVSTYEKSAKAAAQSTAELRAQFGDSAEDARGLLRELAQVQAASAARSVAGASNALLREKGLIKPDASLVEWWFDITPSIQRVDTQVLAEMFDLPRFGKGREQRQAMIGAVAQGFTDVDTAAGIVDEAERIDAMAEATRDLRDAFAEAASASGTLSAAEREILNVLSAQVLLAASLKQIKDANVQAALAESRAGEDRTTRARPVFDGMDASGSNQRRQSLEAEARLGAVIAQHGRDSLEAARARVLAERDRYEAMLRGQAISEAQRAAELAAWDAAKGIPALERDRLATAQALLVELQGQGAIQQAIATYGEDSAQAGRARVNAERAAFTALVDSLVPAGDLRDRLMAAWENAEGLGRTDMASGIAVAAAQARAMADEIVRALGAANALAAQGAAAVSDARLRWQFRDNPEKLAGALASARFNRDAALPAGTEDRTESRIRAREAQVVADARADARINAALSAWLQAQAASARGASGGGRGGAAARDGLAGLTGEAQKMLAELGLAQAAVSEKVRAGLQSVAEGEEEMAQAKRRAAERLAELIGRMTALGPAGEAAADQARAALQGLGVAAEAVGRDIRGGIIDSFEDSFARSLATGKNQMSAFADHIQMELARAFTKKFITPLVTPLIDGFMGLFGGIFSAKGNVFSDGRLVPFAKGGVPGLPGLAAHSDTVVDRPTAFAMAMGQIGIMGEAGAEAILPLRHGPAGEGVLATGPGGRTGVLPLQRGPGGALGVALPDIPGLMARPTFFARGGVVGRMMQPPRIGESGSDDPFPRREGPAVSVVVNNSAPGVRADAREEHKDGGVFIDVVVEQIESSIADRANRGIGPLVGVMGQSFGLSRRGR